MVWVNPPTFVANTALGAAQLNTFIRDNLNETEAARASTAGRLLWTTGRNGIAERPIASALVTTVETTTATEYIDLPAFGPTVTLTTGRYALVFVTCGIGNSGTDFAYANYYISGASDISHNDRAELKMGGNTTGTSITCRTSAISWCTALTPGSNTFTLQYKVSGGEGKFLDRRIMVMGL
jgi:hypothetical protein